MDCPKIKISSGPTISLDWVNNNLTKSRVLMDRQTRKIRKENLSPSKRLATHQTMVILSKCNHLKTRNILVSKCKTLRVLPALRIIQFLINLAQVLLKINHRTLTNSISKKLKREHRPPAWRITDSNKCSSKTLLNPFPTKITKLVVVDSELVSA